MAVLCMAACTQKSTTGYTINGQAEGAVDGDTVSVFGYEFEYYE